MKRIFPFFILAIAALLTTIIACNKNVDGRTDNISALQPANIDLNAGTWKPVLLTGLPSFL